MDYDLKIFLMIIAVINLAAYSTILILLLKTNAISTLENLLDEQKYDRATRRMGIWFFWFLTLTPFVNIRSIFDLREDLRTGIIHWK